MSTIVEVRPDITDTATERDELVKFAQEMALQNKEDDDFVVVAQDDKNELFEESASIFTIDGKNIEFEYISSINKNGIMYSFAQDHYGLWWYFIRTGIASGKALKGPYTTKEKVLKAMGELYA